MGSAAASSTPCKSTVARRLMLTPSPINAMRSTDPAPEARHVVLSVECLHDDHEHCTNRYCDCKCHASTVPIETQYAELVAELRAAKAAREARHRARSGAGIARSIGAPETHGATVVVLPLTAALATDTPFLVALTPGRPASPACRRRPYPSRCALPLWRAAALPTRIPGSAG